MKISSTSVILGVTSMVASVGAVCDVTITAFQLGFTAGQSSACGPTDGGIGFGTFCSWPTRCHHSYHHSSLTLPRYASRRDTPSAVQHRRRSRSKRKSG